MLTRGGLPQQLNRSLYPGQVPGQMSGQMLGQMGGQLGGRATPPVGPQPPFQGLAERALAGMEPYNNAQPKPQATTQQVSESPIPGMLVYLYLHSTTIRRPLGATVLRV